MPSQKKLGKIELRESAIGRSQPLELWISVPANGKAG
jgi:hypothetical protein